MKDPRGRSYTVIPQWNKIRMRIIERDGFKCLNCKMTDEEHVLKYTRHITVNHINGDTDNNTDENLETLCMACHGRKDGIRTQPSGIEPFKTEIVKMYENGMSTREIAEKHKVNTATMRDKLIQWGVGLRGLSAAMNISMKKHKKFTDDEEMQILSEYHSTMKSYKRLAKKYLCSVFLIRITLDRAEQRQRIEAIFEKGQEDE